jgi:hypothetical protein
MIWIVSSGVSSCKGVPQASGGRPSCIIGAPGSWQVAQAPANSAAASGWAASTVLPLSAGGGPCAAGACAIREAK